jgi:DNA-binding NarL/FixJ family response regulator
VNIRVGIADDHALVRLGFRMLLESEPGLEVAGEAADGVAAVELARRELPDVILMDIRMPGLDGIAATSQISGLGQAGAPVRVLVLTTFDLDEYVYAALRAGASGFLLKDTPPRELLAAIRVIAAGDALLSPSVTRKLISEFARLPAVRSAQRLDELTGREQDVLALVARGMSNAEIAVELVVSLATVKTHVSRLLTKLSARDRAQLIVVAYESGFVAPRLSPRLRGGQALVRDGGLHGRGVAALPLRVRHELLAGLRGQHPGDRARCAQQHPGQHLRLRALGLDDHADRRGHPAELVIDRDRHDEVRKRYLAPCHREADLADLRELTAELRRVGDRQRRETLQRCAEHLFLQLAVAEGEQHKTSAGGVHRVAVAHPAVRRMRRAGPDRLDVQHLRAVAHAEMDVAAGAVVQLIQIGERGLAQPETAR